MSIVHEAPLSPSQVSSTETSILLLDRAPSCIAVARGSERKRSPCHLTLSARDYACMRAGKASKRAGKQAHRQSLCRLSVKSMTTTSWHKHLASIYPRPSHSFYETSTTAGEPASLLSTRESRVFWKTCPWYLATVVARTTARLVGSIQALEAPVGSRTADSHVVETSLYADVRQPAHTTWSAGSVWHDSTCRDPSCLGLRSMNGDCRAIPEHHIRTSSRAGGGVLRYWATRRHLLGCHGGKLAAPGLSLLWKGK
jgi:hypothetical protein